MQRKSKKINPSPPRKKKKKKKKHPFRRIAITKKFKQKKRKYIKDKKKA